MSYLQKFVIEATASGTAVKGYIQKVQLSTMTTGTAPESFLKKVRDGVGPLSREAWIEKVQSVLIETLQKYAMQRFRELAPSVTHDWGPEINSDLKRLDDLFDSKKCKTKSSFDLSKAFIEAVQNTKLAQEKVKEAKDIFSTTHLKNDGLKFDKAYEKLLKDGRFRSEDLTVAMLAEFRPKLFKILSGSKHNKSIL